jgi:hypothetical protein
MRNIYIFSLLFFLFECRSANNTRILKISDYSCDTITANDFFNKNEYKYFIENLDTIHPKMYGWAYDLSDRFTESYIINNKNLSIYQPLIVDTIKYNKTKLKGRYYFYDDKQLKTIRILVDSLDFNFDSVFFDYGYTSDNIYKKDNFIILINEPMGWCGSANQYAFFQVFDLNNSICYEFFENIYYYK